MALSALNDKIRTFVGYPPDPLRVAAILAGAVVFVALVGGLVTQMNMDWYHGLLHPWIVPPDWAFGPAWTVMFLLMTIAAWLVWRRIGWPAARVPLFLWGTQLFFNMLWSVIFFGFHTLGLAFIESLMLLAAVALTTKAFFAADRVAGWLMAPVAVWVAYASLLSFCVWQVN